MKGRVSMQAQFSHHFEGLQGTPPYLFLLCLSLPELPGTWLWSRMRDHAVPQSPRTFPAQMWFTPAGGSWSSLIPSRWPDSREGGEGLAGWGEQHSL